MRALRQGSDMRSRACDERVRALGAVTGGSGAGRNLLSSADWKRVGQRLKLAPRELELVQHVFDGKKLLAVARAMNLSLGTVKTYSQRIRQKLQVRDQVELTLAVVGAHLQEAVPTP